MRLLLLILLASAVAGCGAGSVSPPSDVAAPKESAAAKPARRCAAGAVKPVGSRTTSYAAVVESRAEAYRRPGSGRLATFGAENVNGVPTVFAVLAKRVAAGCAATWYRVQLPMKPNGIIGWVRARDVSLAPVTTRIVVDLSERRVTLFDRGREVVSATAAIGSPKTPTPTGRFYVNQRLVPEDPAGPFGPGAVGISAFSEVLTGWAQGGPVAIHGTNRPELIGLAVSNGCIRVANRDLRRLFGATLAGTPVVVHA